MFEPIVNEFDICDEHNKRIPYNKSLDDRYYNMLKRCYNKDNKMYYRYGERGIQMCDEWKNDKSVFVRWSFNNGYNKELELDRINNDGNYEPSNCRWITRLENRRNR